MMLGNFFRYCVIYCVVPEKISMNFKIKDPFSLTVMHRGRVVVSGTQKVAIRVLAAEKSVSI